MRRSLVILFVESDLKGRSEPDNSEFLNVDKETKTLDNLSVSLVENDGRLEM